MCQKLHHIYKDRTNISLRVIRLEVLGQSVLALNSCAKIVVRVFGVFDREICGERVVAETAWFVESRLDY